ncbi:helix-turn-helix domain-containing protein [Elusimicrobiota bacterium]
MDRKRISRKRDGSWSGRPRRLGPRSKASSYDPTVTLRDPVFVQKAILQALREGDFESVLGIWRAHLRALNRSRSAKALKISRQYLHRILNGRSKSPSLRTFAAFMRALKEEVEAAA